MASKRNSQEPSSKFSHPTVQAKRSSNKSTRNNHLPSSHIQLSKTKGSSSQTELE
uniref:Uncharacterized protein n=1 Tax=Arundo donax TaxID=35708 RepID=A0A0A9H057_ARUDO